jgi:hypothetical protein
MVTRKNPFHFFLNNEDYIYPQHFWGVRPLLIMVFKTIIKRLFFYIKTINKQFKKYKTLKMFWVGRKNRGVGVRKRYKAWGGGGDRKPLIGEGRVFVDYGFETI